MSEVFVGRQPIYDRKLKVFGYELLFRAHASAQHAEFDDADQATVDVLLNSFVEIGLPRIVGDGVAFLNLTRDFFIGARTLPFPKERVFMEMLEDIEVDEPLLTGIRVLKEQGYRVALDDFLFRPSLLPLLDLADVVKLDVLAIEDDEIASHVEELRSHDVHLLAEKVETQEMYERCRGLGFDYFQGFFLCRPHVVRGRRLPASRLAALRLLAALQDPAVEVVRMEEMLRQDAGLSMKLLQLVNSAFHGLPQRVESMRQALVLLGIDRVRAWTSILVLASIDDRPGELLVTALLRARMCELIAESERLGAPESYFTAGLLTVLDALLDQPMDRVLARLPLTDSMNRALLHHEGELGHVLDRVLRYEQTHWESLDSEGVDLGSLADHYLAALLWANATHREVRS